jgi:hypothetical protein
VIQGVRTVTFQFEYTDGHNGFWYLVLDNGVKIVLNDKAVPGETQPLMQKAEIAFDTIKALWHGNMGPSDMKDLFIKRQG